MENLHFIQLQILRKLLFGETMSFSELNETNLGSEQFSYHLKTLLNNKLIQKDENGLYSLTLNGKKLTADLKIENLTFNDRAKLSVLCVITKNTNGKNELLMIKRLKSPFKGFLCFVAGKVEYEVGTVDVVKREVKEEIDIDIQNPRFSYFFRQFVYDTNGKFLKNNSFCIFHATEFTGIPKATPEANPVWITEENFRKEKHKAYDVEDIYNFVLNPPESRFIEKSYYTEGF